MSDWPSLFRQVLAFCRRETTLGVVLAGCALYISVMTHGLPFYWEDLQWIQGAHLSGDVLRRVLLPTGAPDFGKFERPAEALMLASVRALAGYQAVYFHAFKTAALTGALILVALILRMHGASRLFAGLALVSIVVAPPVFQSTAWICDFELPAQALLLGAFSLFLISIRKAESATRLATQALLQSGMILLLILAMATKGDTRIAPLVILVFLVLRRRVLLRRYAVLLGITLVYAVFPVATSQGGVLVERPLFNMALFLFQALLFLAAPLVALFALAGSCVGRFKQFRPAAGSRSGPPFGAAPPALLDLAVFAGVWLAFSAFLWPLLPSGETRYLAGTTLALGVCVAAWVSVFMNVPFRTSFRQRATAALVTALFLQALFNVYHCVQYRAFWGSFHIAADRVVHYVDTNYQNARVLYRYWRPFLHSPETTNQFTWLGPIGERDDGRTAQVAATASSPSSAILAVRGASRAVEDFLQARGRNHRVVGSDGGLFETCLRISGLRVRLVDPGTGKILGPVAWPFVMYVYSGNQVAEFLALPAPAELKRVGF